MLNEFIDKLMVSFPIGVADRVEIVHWVEAMAEYGLDATDIRQIIRVWAINKAVSD